jgi:hypothetical protein
MSGPVLIMGGRHRRDDFQEARMTGSRSDDQEDLVESQGVNAGPPPDEDPPPASKDDHPETGGSPDERDMDAGRNDEMVGLPEQKPGYPGQQRSVDTS